MKLIVGVVSSLLVASCLSAPQQGLQSTTPSVDDLIKQVFGSPNGGQAVQSTTPSVDNLIKQVFGSPNAGQAPGVLVEPNRSAGNPERINADSCECVPYYQCQNNSIIDNGIGLIDIRLQGPCDDYLDACCQPPDIIPPESKITPKPQIRKGCGQRNVNGVGFRITGAKDGEAQFGEFPWTVAILKEEPIGKNGELVNVYQCGGAIIHPNVVLTAAHCVNGKEPTSLKIRAGEWDTQTKNEIFPHQDRQVASYAVHERFHSGALHNDFALLRLAQPVDIMENVDVVCLPEANTNFDFQRCFASGWGKDIFGKEGHYQVILKKVELPIVPWNVCQDSLRTTRLGKYFKLDKSFTCAGGEHGKDTCKGDGGSPLVCPVANDPSRYYQTGIVAWGIGCGENQVPGVYANVAYARNWIDQKMYQWGFDNEYYSYRP